MSKTPHPTKREYEKSNAQTQPVSSTHSVDEQQGNSIIRNEAPQDNNNGLQLAKNRSKQTMPSTCLHNTASRESGHNKLVAPQQQRNPPPTYAQSQKMLEMQDAKKQLRNKRFCLEAAQRLVKLLLEARREAADLEVAELFRDPKAYFEALFVAATQK